MPTRTILHVDMDAFFTSVEQRDDPSLRGKPVVVGGDSKRGVVAAASYEARPFGVRSAMPMVEALRRCPQAIVVTPTRGRYLEASRQIFSAFRRFTPLVEGLSLDEAFLDVTGSQALFGDGRTIAARIREEIRAETGLTASAGVAPSKFVAKIASDMDKPDGLFVVEPGEVAAFLAPLPIARMWGVGPKAAAGLATRGYRTFSDLVAAGPAVLERELGSWGASVFRLAQGEDPREVIADREAKSLGSEQTFEQDLRRPEDLARALLGQSATVAGRLVVAGLAGSVVAVKLKYADFQVRTRQARSPEPIQDTESIHRMAKELLQRFPRRPMGIRLTGVSVSDLVPDDTPAGLFPDAATLRRKALEKTVSDLSKRLGKQVVTRASLLGTRRDRGASDGD